VKFEDVFESETSVELVFEYMGGGDLCNYLLKEENLSEVDIAKVMKALLKALEYLHRNRVIH
jgi:serine/threonine protein kinase